MHIPDNQRTKHYLDSVTYANDGCAVCSRGMQAISFLNLRVKLSALYSLVTKYDAKSEAEYSEGDS